MMDTLTRADMAHLQRATEVARTSTQRQRHGAVIAIGRKVLAVGVNSFRCHPTVATNPKREASFHAEVAVMRQLNEADSRMTVFVARVSRAGLPVLSEPCPNCKNLLRVFGISKVVFTVEGGYAVCRL